MWLGSDIEAMIPSQIIYRFKPGHMNAYAKVSHFAFVLFKTQESTLKWKGKIQVIDIQ